MTGKDKDKEKDSEKNKQDTPDEQDIEKIIKTGSVSAGESDSCIHCISIVGQIEGHYILDQTQKATKYEQLLPLLFSIEESRDVR
ncbi:MAG: peptidase S14, partial [Clostridia bacterium]|nr:peptidase S14 [Clostridia bacterium]